MSYYASAAIFVVVAFLAAVNDVPKALSITVEYCAIFDDVGTM